MKILSITLFLSILLFNANAQPDWQWANSFGQSEDASYPSTDIKDIATDSNGNYYVVGLFDGTITGDGFYFYDKDPAEQLTGMIVGFNGNGEYLWHQQIYTDDGTQYAEVSINGVATDGNGDVYVTGSFDGTANISETISITSTAVGTSSMFVVKYSGADGTPIWADDAAGTSSSDGRNIAIDSNNDIYITGYFSGDADFGIYPLAAESTDGFVTKYNSSGICQWASKLGSTSSDYCSSIAIDNSDNVFVVGMYSGTPTIGSTTLPNGDMDMFIAKATSAGVWQNANSFSTGYYQFTHDIDCDSDGNVFIVGNFYTSIDFGDGLQSFSNTPGYLAKYDNSLTYQWNKIMESTLDDPDNGTDALKIDAENNIIVVGSFQGILDFGSGISISETIGSHQAPYIAKFNNAGEIQYAQAFNNIIASSGGEGLAIDVVGNSIFVAGELNNALTIGSHSVGSPGNAKYIWVASDFIPTSTDNDILTFTLAEQIGEAIIDTENHTVVIGVAEGTNVAELTPTITVSENATINPEGGTQQNFTNPVEYTVTAENSDAQIWTITVDIVSGINSIESQFSIYPNPSNGIFTLENGNLVVRSIEIADITGKTIENHIINSQSSIINLENHAKGVYFLRINTEKGSYTKRLIIQ